MKKTDIKLKRFVFLLIFSVLFFSINIYGNVSAEDDEGEEKISCVSELYDNVLSIDDLDMEEPAVPQQFSAQLFSMQAQTVVVYDNVNDASAYLLEGIRNNEAEIFVPFRIAKADVPDIENRSELAKMIYYNAWNSTLLADTDDYQHYRVGGFTGGISPKINKEDDYWTGTMRYVIIYYTTPEQEAELDQKTEETLTGLKLEEKTDYEKFVSIYQYVCSHVTYDYTHLSDTSYKLQYTAYAALMNGTAVCQGYASLFCKLMTKAGFHCRIIPGIGNGQSHAWNIVEYNDVWYNMDTTWDSFFTDNISQYAYFMENQKDFSGHELISPFRNVDSIRFAAYPYDSAEFNTTYPMSNETYYPSVETLVIDPEEITLTGRNAEHRLTISSLPVRSKATEVVFESLNTHIAEVDDTGTIIAKHNGTVQIKASLKELDIQSVCSVTVNGVDEYTGLRMDENQKLRYYTDGELDDTYNDQAVYEGKTYQKQNGEWIEFIPTEPSLIPVPTVEPVPISTTDPTTIPTATSSSEPTIVPTMIPTAEPAAVQTQHQISTSNAETINNTEDEEAVETTEETYHPSSNSTAIPVTSDPVNADVRNLIRI